jgi:hypothetical protein
MILVRADLRQGFHVISCTPEPEYVMPLARMIPPKVRLQVKRRRSKMTMSIEEERDGKLERRLEERLGLGVEMEFSL